MTALPLFGSLPEDLVRHFAAQDPAMTLPEARRLLAHAWRHPGAPWTSMARPVRRVLHEAVDERTSRPSLKILERIEDSHDGSCRYLLQSPDGARSEAVRIPLERPGRFTVCLSSQVGCAMRCTFCATGRLGLTRNLETWEMVEAFRVVRDEAPGQVSGAVFMGQGEPLHNYDHVMHAAAVLSHPCAARISADAITISTVGLVPQILRYAAEGHRYRLIVSLSSAVEARRAELLPVAGRWPLPELAHALRVLHAATGDRVTVAWVLLGGVNSGADEVAGLRALLGDLPLRVNLIDVNDNRPDGYRRADDDERARLLDALRELGAPVVRRYSVGQGQNSACGMLAALASATEAGQAPAEWPPTGGPPRG